MDSKQKEYFWGCFLEDEEADEVLGVKEELIEQYGEEEAEELYDGACESACNILGNEYVWDIDGELFIGDLLDSEDDETRKTEITQELLNSLPNLDESKFALYSVNYDEEGEVESFDEIEDIESEEE